jgi:hypothetical protein
MWTSYGDYNYTLYFTPLTFGAAAVTCTQAGGYLASFPSFTEYSVSLEWLS